MPTDSKKRRSSRKKIDTKIILALIPAAAVIVAALIQFGLPSLLQRTQVATSTPTGTATLIPTLTATATDTVTPTFTATPTLLSPLALGNISDCDPNFAKRLFNYALSQSSELASALGGEQMTEPLCVESTYQPFAGGEMIWRADDEYIYVLFATGELQLYENNYRKGEKRSCRIDTLSKNEVQPVLGFEKVWCQNSGVRARLGYGTIAERYSRYAIKQFEDGWLILIDYTVHAILTKKGQWDSIDAFTSTQIELGTRSDLDTKTSNLGLEQEHLVYLPKAPLKIIDPLTGKMISTLFEVGQKVSTQCADTPQYADKIQIATSILQPIRVYLLLQAGWGVKSYEYRTIGKVSLMFDNAEPVETNLILGANIRDWAERSIAISSLTFPNVQPAWQGFDGEIPGQIDLLILDIPRSHLFSTLKEIQIEDSSISSTGSMDPCIHLSGITVSYLP